MHDTQYMKNKKEHQYRITGKSEELYTQFFQIYDYEHLRYKLRFLNACYDSDEVLSGFAGSDNPLGDFRKWDIEKAKKMIRTESHFLFFQVVEVLFSFIFLMRKHEKEIWPALVFCNGKNSPYYFDIYQSIKTLNKDSVIFQPGRVQYEEGDIVEMTFVEYLFYYGIESDLEMSEEEHKRNMENVKEILLKLAKEFTERKQEYNSYKHGLRFYNSPFMFGLGKNGGKSCITWKIKRFNYFFREKRGKGSKRNISTT